MLKGLKVELQFKYKGLACVIVFHYCGHRCGYVGITEEHSLYGKDLDYILDRDTEETISSSIKCHGGLSFAGGGKNSNYPINSSLWWFGFDCAHICDGRDFQKAYNLFPELTDRIRNLEMIDREVYGDKRVIQTTNHVIAECKKLAEQLLKFE